MLFVTTNRILLDIYQTINERSTRPLVAQLRQPVSTSAAVFGNKVHKAHNTPWNFDPATRPTGI
jgi:hypothetical protein